VTSAIPIHTPGNWKDYELIDSGAGKKLERFGTYILSRPAPNALWLPRAKPAVWKKANASYVHRTETTGDWKIHKSPPNNWHITYNKLTFMLRPATFKHVGVFPEQAPNWDWLERQIQGKPLRVLNLFAYTGGATLASLAAGAHVTHVDASKPSVTWAKENAQASKLQNHPVRWIRDDVYKFVLRESRRGNTYDAIIMDPPRFGRGADGEIWKIETDLPKLLLACRAILSPEPSFFLLNAYFVNLSSIDLSNLLGDCLQKDKAYEFGELSLKDTTSGRFLPNGIFARWSAAS